MRFREIRNAERVADRFVSNVSYFDSFDPDTRVKPINNNIKANENENDIFDPDARVSTRGI